MAPAFFGGFVISGRDEDGAFYAVPSTVDPRIAVVVFVPPDPVSTEVARGLLPAEVPHADAAADAGRAALLVAALAGKPEQLLRATRDYLHQDYRRPAMPESLALVDRLRADGVAAIVSGAGPTVLAFTQAGAGRHGSSRPAARPGGRRTRWRSTTRAHGSGDRSGVPGVTFRMPGGTVVTAPASRRSTSRRHQSPRCTPFLTFARELPCVRPHLPPGDTWR